LAAEISAIMIEGKYHSQFKSPITDVEAYHSWVGQVTKLSNRTYESTVVKTDLGNTQVWGLNWSRTDLPALVIFPGARTSALFWDLDGSLSCFENVARIFLVETNGLPNCSEGQTPDIKGDGYGHWAASILTSLNLEKPFVAGASFGGLICAKLAITHSQLPRAIFMLNPGCLQPFSLKLKNLYYNLLPIVSPTEKNVRKFLDKAIFCKPNQSLSPQAEQLLVDYELLALKQYIDKTQKPYFMSEDLRQVNVPVYLLLGSHDLLFPYSTSEKNARALLPMLQEVKVFDEVAHGIETYTPALQWMSEKLKALSSE
jgi:pimeloyl-ACP methyl ester carboxylesterase